MATFYEKFVFCYEISIIHVGNDRLNIYCQITQIESRHLQGDDMGNRKNIMAISGLQFQYILRCLSHFISHLAGICILVLYSLSLLNAAENEPGEWRPLDRDKGYEKTVFSVNGETITINGCLRRDVPIPIDDAIVDMKSEVFLPAQAAQWASVALTLFGSTDDQRCYAKIILNRNGLEKDSVELALQENKIVKKLPRDTWINLRFSRNDREFAVKAWPVPGPEPADWDLRMPNSNVSWEIAGYGPRTYAVSGKFRNLTCSLKAGAAWKKSIPRPIFDADPSLVTLYETAWRLAWKHVKTADGVPQSPYMDEACWNDAIWIWDTCFMSLYCKYAPDVFPGVESLNNFYVPMHGGGKTSLRIVHKDNPPLFSWVEYDYCKFTNNHSHIEQLISRDRYLQKHYQWFANPTTGPKPTALIAEPDGYRWNGVASGMDNTPRDRKRRIYWVDALAQQGLSALYISRLSQLAGNSDEENHWMDIYVGIKNKVNELYWDEKTGAYYDIDARTHEKTGILTPSSFWPMLAEMCTQEQAARLVKHIEDPRELGGIYPWVSVSRDDKDFNASTGDYWRGGIWLPLAYMGVKALEKYRYFKLADETSERLLAQMNETFKNYDPHTIWECYSPNQAQPSTEHGRRARPSFCGWSALGPISLFIENILGFHSVDALKNEVQWRLHQSCKHGIEHLRFGEIDTDILYDGGGGVTVKSTGNYTLVINGRKNSVVSGINKFSAQVMNE